MPWALQELQAPERNPGAQGQLPAGVRVRRFPSLAAASPRLRGKALAAVSSIGPLAWRAALGFPHVLTRGYRAALKGETSRADGPFQLVVGGVLPHTHFLEPAARFPQLSRRVTMRLKTGEAGA